MSFDTSTLPEPQRKKLHELAAGQFMTGVERLDGGDVVLYVPGQGYARISPDGSTAIRTHAEIVKDRDAGQ